MTLTFVPAAAGGGGGFAGATEVTQIANNVELALQSAEEMAQTYELVDQTYIARLQQMRESIGEYTQMYQQTVRTLDNVRTAGNRLSVMQFNLTNLRSALNTRFREQAASNLSWEQFVNRERSRIANGNVRAVSAAEANREVIVASQASMEAYQRAAEGMEQSTGTHQATRIMGAQLTQLGGDLNQLLTLTATTNLKNADAEVERNEELERARRNREAMRLDRQRAADATRRFAEELSRRAGTAGIGQ